MRKSYIIFVLLLVGLFGYGQRCDNKDLCDKDFFGDFDFRSQSNYTYVYTGDTLRVKVVIYSGQEYRIFTCAERKLKDTYFRIIYPEKRCRRVVKEVAQKYVPIYERDKEGNFVFDETGERIMTGTIFANDTVWGRELETSESVIYESNKAEIPYWEANIHKTRLIIIETIIPKGRKSASGCIQIMVGRRYKSANPFRR
jgi:hypothetical protein